MAHGAPGTRRRIFAPAAATIALMLLCSIAPSRAAMHVLGPGKLRVPPPGYLVAGEPMTGTAEVMAILPDGSTRQALPEEITGVIRMGEGRIPVRNGRFVIESLPAGQHVINLFQGDEVGAEIARTTLIVPERPLAPSQPAGGPPSAFRGPLAIQQGGNLLVAGPFAGAGDDPVLSLDGTAARLLWESRRAALFAPGAAAPGGRQAELRIRGKLEATLEIFGITIRPVPPEPPVTSNRGEIVSFGATVGGLPPREVVAAVAAVCPAVAHPRDDEPLLHVVFKSLSPRTLTDLWSKSGGVRREGDDLLVPVTPSMIGPEGEVLLSARAKGKSHGEIRIGSELSLSETLTGACRSFVPAGQ